MSFPGSTPPNPAEIKRKTEGAAAIRKFTRFAKNKTRSPDRFHIFSYGVNFPLSSLSNENSNFPDFSV